MTSEIHHCGEISPALFNQLCTEPSSEVQGMALSAQDFSGHRSSAGWREPALGLPLAAAQLRGGRSLGAWDRR